jgi:dCMP deaminase
MMIAKTVSLRSTCNSRPVGCVIVKDRHIIACGYNGAVSGENHCSDVSDTFCRRRDSGISDTDKADFCLAVHAEKNAIAYAARHGMSVDYATAYITLSPCLNCMLLMETAGIREIFFETQYISENFERDLIWIEYGRKHFDQFRKIAMSVRRLAELSDSLDQITSLRRMA